MLKIFFWIGGQTCGGTRLGWLEYDLSNPKQILIKSNLSLLRLEGIESSRWKRNERKIEKVPTASALLGIIPLMRGVPCTR
tara:strand:- start:221 stop:463 length:243 start_codon:yes stop_codon:yes gene_type:complete